MCTLGISRVWGEDPEGGVALLLAARTIATELGKFDEVFRATANLTTALDLLGRKREAVEVAQAGIEAAHQAGQEAVFGNFLRGNGADSSSCSASGRRPGRSSRRPSSGARSGSTSSTRSRTSRPSRSRCTPAKRPDGSSAGCCSSSRRCPTPRNRCRRTRPPRPSPCGGATSRTPGAPSAWAGAGFARPRTGSSWRGWPPSSSRSMRHPWRPPGPAATCRRSPPPGRAAARSSPRPRGSSRTPGSTRRSAHAARRTRTWPWPGPTGRGSTAATSPPPGRRSPGRGRHSSAPTRWPARAGARPRPRSVPVTDGPDGRPPGRRSSKPSALARELGAGPLLRELEELARRALIPLPDSADGAVAIEVGARSRASEPVLVPVGARPGSDRRVRGRPGLGLGREHGRR